MMATIESTTINGVHSREASGNIGRLKRRTIGAHLEQHAGEDHAAGGGRFHVRVGQPGMEREHGNLDRERSEKGEEEPHLKRRPIRALAQLKNVECMAALEIQDQNRHQQQDTAGKGIEEEFDRRIETIWPTPDPDQKVHRDQHRLPKYIEQHKIQAPRTLRSWRFP